MLCLLSWPQTSLQSRLHCFEGKQFPVRVSTSEPISAGGLDVSFFPAVKPTSDLQPLKLCPWLPAANTALLKAGAEKGEINNNPQRNSALHNRHLPHALPCYPSSRATP